MSDQSEVTQQEINSSGLNPDPKAPSTKLSDGEGKVGEGSWAAFRSPERL